MRNMLASFSKLALSESTFMLPIDIILRFAFFCIDFGNMSEFKHIAIFSESWRFSFSADI